LSQEQWNLTADDLQYLIVWDANTGEKLLHIKDFDDNQIWKAAWSSDSIQIATHSRTNIGNIWDAATGEKLLRFSGHTGEVWGLFWLPTGERLSTGGYGHTLGASVGVGPVEMEGEIITDDFVMSGSYEIDIAGVRFPAKVSLMPMYDPLLKRVRS
jgi:WD40 repeat protein